MGIEEAITPMRGAWRRLVPTNWFRSRTFAAEPPEAPTAPAATVEPEPWWRDRKVRQAIFDDLVTWLQLNVEINRNWTALEFGVGELGFATFYKKYVQRMIALDVHDYSSFHSGVEFLLSDGKTIPLEDETVDLVTSHSVLEHVEDLHQSIREISRVLKVGGYAFLTVNPLYYAAAGSHVNGPTPLLNWEHLDPTSSYYLLENPTGRDGDYLNKLTSARMLEAVGTVPWDILRYEIRTEAKPAPDFALKGGIPAIDLYVQEFRLVAQRRARLAPNGPAVVPPHPYPRGNQAPRLS